MSEFKIGDRVFLECVVREKDMSDDTYRLTYEDCSVGHSITDFVKDDVLHTPDEAYNKGLNDAWELAKKIVLPDHLGGYTVDELGDIFGKNYFISLMNTYTPQEALAKVKAYEEERNEIKVGDVVTVKDGVSDFESIVTKVSGRVVYRLFMDGSCDGHAYKEDLEKTGRHFDSIDEFMKS